jgi:hypothetical protein
MTADRCPHGYPARIDSTGIGCRQCRLAEGRAERDRGMARAEASLHAAWDRAVIDQAITVLAATGRAFSANDVRDRLPDVRPALVGARFMHAARRGLIERIGDELATHKAGHARRVSVWRGRRRHTQLTLDDQGSPHTPTTPEGFYSSGAAWAPSSPTPGDDYRKDTPA